MFQAGQRNKKFDKVIQSVDDEELSKPISSAVVNTPPEIGGRHFLYVCLLHKFVRSLYLINLILFLLSNTDIL